MRIRSILCVVACGLLLLVGCGQPEFKEFASVEGKFTVSLPGTPEEKTEPVAGTTMTIYFLVVGARAYAVSFMELPIPDDEPEEMVQTRLDDGRDGMLRNVNATLVTSSNITLAGKHPGRDVVGQLSDNRGMVRSKIYLSGKRHYQVLVMGPKSFVESAEATRFLDSLALTP
jgi:hypothetical protein